jgi:hypothetical protein
MSEKKTAEEILAEKWRDKTGKWFMNSTANKYKDVFLLAMQEYSTQENESNLSLIRELTKALEDAKKQILHMNHMDESGDAAASTAVTIKDIDSTLEKVKQNQI